jgi:hypothetical protein
MAMSIGKEFIANTPHGLYELGLVWINFDLVSQGRHEPVNAPLSDKIVISPDRI